MSVSGPGTRVSSTESLDPTGGGSSATASTGTAIFAGWGDSVRREVPRLSSFKIDVSAAGDESSFVSAKKIKSNLGPYLTA